jgi:hypothetical protein
MSEEEHIIMENSVNEDVDKGIELSILSGWQIIRLFGSPE